MLLHLSCQSKYLNPAHVECKCEGRTCVSRRSSSPLCSSSCSTEAWCPLEYTAAPGQRPTHLKAANTHRERHSQRNWRWRCFQNCCMCVQRVNTTYFYLTLQTAFLPLSFADFFSDSDLKSPWGCPSLSFYLKVESTFILGEGRQSRPSG